MCTEHNLCFEKLLEVELINALFGKLLKKTVSSVAINVKFIINAKIISLQHVDTSGHCQGKK